MLQCSRCIAKGTRRIVIQPYHLPKLLIGFSATVGIGPLSIKNLVSLNLPLIIETLQHLLGLICILAFAIFCWSFLIRCSLQGIAVVKVVMSSINALIGVNRFPDFILSPLTTHLKDRIMTSVAIVKVSEEMVQPAIIPICKGC